MIESYYLSGLPINLTKFNLGYIKQLTYKEILEKEIDLDKLLKPFQFRKEMLMGQSEENDILINNLGNLGFLYFIKDEIKDFDLIESLKDSLKVLYDTDNVHVNPETKYIEVDEIVIDVDRFEILSDVVYEMFKMDKPKFENELDMDEVDKEFARRRKKHEEKLKKKKQDGLQLKDIINIIVHSNECGLNYNKVFNMTIYQIKNSFDTLMIKHNSESTFKQLMSQNFDVSKIKFKDWHSEKIVKSSAVD